MKSHRIKSLVSDEDFLGLVADIRVYLTKKVMAQATSPEERQELLAEYHALDRLMNRMRSEAHNAENTDNG